MYNEIRYIPQTINRIKIVLCEIASDYEIIIVDDASTDGSAEKLEEIFSSEKNIKIIRNDKNRQLGYTLKKGFSYASKDIIIYTDFDMPFDYSVINNVIDLIDNCDVVRGYRIGGNIGFLRKILSRTYDCIVSIFFKTNMQNINFSLKIFRRTLLDYIKLNSNSSFIDAEFLIKTHRAGYLIKEIGVVYYSRIYGRSNLSSIKVILKTLSEMSRYYFKTKSYILKHYANYPEINGN